MAIPIINNWRKYFENPDEGLGSSYERIVLNRIIRQTNEKYGVNSILETPSFGFTGLSGINLIDAAKAGAEVFLEDDDPTRLDLIKGLWSKLGLQAKFRLNKGFRSLDYPDKSIDLSFNFSALWFVDDLGTFLRELSRISQKAIFISVPNQGGIGYKGQLKGYSKALYPQLKPAYIDKASIISLLRRQGWHLAKAAYFDCPLWPDIGMSKEDFVLGKLPGLKALLDRKKRSVQPTVPKNSVMNYYQGYDPGFADRMERLGFFEHYAPLAFKRIWAHHYYMIFVPDEI